MKFIRKLCEKIVMGDAKKGAVVECSTSTTAPSLLIYDSLLDAPLTERTPFSTCLRGSIT